MLELQNIKITHNQKELFKPLNLSVSPGEIATIMGPSGCGKSTLLSLISGALPDVFDYSGQVVLHLRLLNDLPMEKRHVGVLFQDDLLFPHLNVAGNLKFALPSSIKGQVRQEMVLEALQKAGLGGFEDRDVATLSGGQKARISLLRTLLAKPQAVLLDEPFSKLDEKLRESFKIFVKKQVEEMNIPALLVTHDASDMLGTQLIKLTEGEGNNV